MGDGPGGAALCVVHGMAMLTHMIGQEAAQRANDGGGHFFSDPVAVMLTGKFAAELFDECAAVFFAAMGEVELDHGGVDVAMT
jgi:hypothetical protein